MGDATVRESVWQSQRFRLLFAARTISVLGSAFAPIALAFGVLGIPGADTGTLSTVLAAQAVPRLALMLLGGVIGDRLPRYRVLVGAELIAAVAYGGLGAAFVFGWTPLALLVVLATTTGLASALLLPSLTGVVAEVVDEDRLQSANAMLRLGANAARISGIAAAGVTVGLLGPGIALLADAASCVVGAALLAALRLPGVVKHSGKSVLSDLRVGWQELRSRPWLWQTLVAAALINAATLAGFNALGPVVAEERLGGATAWSVVLGAYAVGMLSGVMVALRIRPRRPLYAAAGSATLLAGPLVALGLDAPLIVVAAAAFVSGVAFDVFGVLWETTVQREVPREVISRITAYEYLGALGLGPVGLAIAGPLSLAIGVGPAIGVFAAIVLGAALAMCAARQIRKVTAEEGDR